MHLRLRLEPRLGGVVCAAAIACFGLGLEPQRVAAQPRTALSWVREPGAEQCIAAPELGRQVERLIGPVLSSAAEGQVSIEGRIAHDSHGFVATIAVSDAEGAILGRRELRGGAADCRALDEQLAFVIAVAIDPDAALALLPGEFAADDEPGEALLAELQAHPPRPAARPAVTTPAPRPPAPPPAQPEGTWSLHAAAGPALGVGMAAGSSAGPSVELGVARKGWMLRLGAVYWLPRATSIQGGLGVDIGLWQLGFAGCRALWTQAGWEFALCGGPIVARLSAAPADFEGNERNGWLFGPELAGRLGRQLSAGAWVVLGIAAQSLWPRHAVVYESGGRPHAVYRVPYVMGALGLSLELRF